MAPQRQRDALGNVARATWSGPSACGSGCGCALPHDHPHPHAHPAPSDHQRGLDRIHLGTRHVGHLEPPAAASKRKPLRPLLLED